MKIKNILFLVVVTFFSQAIKSAELTVHGRRSQGITAFPCTVYWKCPFSSAIKSERTFLYNQRSHRFSTKGACPFIAIEWSLPDSHPLANIYDSHDQPIESVYRAYIPSSPTMLNGEIQIGDNGNYSINFDKNGASERKIRVERASVEIKNNALIAK